MDNTEISEESISNSDFGAWITKLQRIADELGTISLKTEDEFLKIGENLYNCSKENMECASQVSSIIETIDSDSCVILEKTEPFLFNKKEQVKLFCNRAGDRCSHITPEIREIVSAIQFHDITRQQMEHVGKSLTDIVEKIVSLQGRDGDERVMLNHWVAKALEIQNAQLENIVNETIKAKESILNHLTKVLTLTSEQAEDAKNLTDFKDDSIPWKMESSVSEINEIRMKAKNLEIQISQVISSISFDKVIKSRLDMIRAEISEILSRVNEVVLKDDLTPKEFSPDLAELLNRYTMKSERSVHEAIVEGSDLGDIDLFGMDEGGDSLATESDDKEENDFGDNIELF